LHSGRSRDRLQTIRKPTLYPLSYEGWIRDRPGPGVDAALPIAGCPPRRWGDVRVVDHGARERRAVVDEVCLVLDALTSPAGRER
jgi:hypothetical protein